MGFFDNYGVGANAAFQAFQRSRGLKRDRELEEKKLSRQDKLDEENRRRWEEERKSKMEEARMRQEMFLLQKAQMEQAQADKLYGREQQRGMMNAATELYAPQRAGAWDQPNADPDMASLDMRGDRDMNAPPPSFGKTMAAMGPYLKSNDYGEIIKEQMRQSVKEPKEKDLAFDEEDKLDPITGFTFKRKVGRDKITGEIKYKGEWRTTGERKADTEKNDTEITLVAKAAKGDPSAKRTLAALLDHKKQVAAAGRDPSRLDKSDRMFSVTLRKEFNALPEVKESNSVKPKIQSMEAAYGESLATKNFVAVDQALITLFNKLTDPTSVVRESEYARTAMNIPLINAIKGKAMKVLEGGAGLTPAERKSLLEMARLMKRGYDDIKQKRLKEYRSYAANAGLDPAKTFAEEIGPLPEVEKPGAGKFVIERRTTKSGKKLVKYSDGTIGEE